MPSRTDLFTQTLSQSITVLHAKPSKNNFWAEQAQKNNSWKLALLLVTMAVCSNGLQVLLENRLYKIYEREREKKEKASEITHTLSLRKHIKMVRSSLSIIGETHIFTAQRNIFQNDSCVFTRDVFFDRALHLREGKLRKQYLQATCVLPSEWKGEEKKTHLWTASKLATRHPRILLAACLTAARCHQ